MEATRVTVDEVKQRMDRGEVFTFVDTRNPIKTPHPNVFKLGAPRPMTEGEKIGIA